VKDTIYIRASLFNRRKKCWWLGWFWVIRLTTLNEIIIGYAIHLHHMLTIFTDWLGCQDSEYCFAEVFFFFLSFFAEKSLLFGFWSLSMIAYLTVQYSLHLDCLVKLFKCAEVLQYGQSEDEETQSKTTHKYNSNK